MVHEERLDLIVVGGGPAGLTCAIEASAAKLNVLVLERGDYCGSKNLSGGRLYLPPLGRVLSPAAFTIVKESPLERQVTKEIIMAASEKGGVKVEFESYELRKAPSSWTVLRAKLDNWLASKAQEMGATIVCESRGDEVVMGKDGTARGVKVKDEVIESRFVVLAEGVLGGLAAKAGIAPPRTAGDVFVGVKETILLDRRTIENRFGIAPDGGAAVMAFGSFTKGVAGAGFIYTNRESLSLGVVLNLADLASSGGEGLEPWSIIEEFKARSEIATLIEGGKTAEYGAHLIPELYTLPSRSLGSKNVLVVGDAAGLVANQLVTVRGMDMAIASGSIAAQAICEVLSGGGIPKEAAAVYERKLKGSFVWRDLASAAHAHRFARTKSLYGRWPEKIYSILDGIYRIGPDGKGRFLGKALREVRKEALSWGAIKSYIQLRKT